MEDKFIEAHKSINLATKMLSIDRDHTYGKEDEERYDEIISGLFDVKYMLNKLEDNIRKVLTNIRWYLKAEDLSQEGRSAGQPKEAIREELGKYVTLLEGISNDE